MVTIKKRAIHFILPQFALHYKKRLYTNEDT